MFRLILMVAIIVVVLVSFIILPLLRERRERAKQWHSLEPLMQPDGENTPPTPRVEVVVSELLQHSRHAMPAGMVISRVRRSWPQFSAQDIERALAMTVTYGWTRRWQSQRLWQVYQATNQTC